MQYVQRFLILGCAIIAVMLQLQAVEENVLSPHEREALNKEIQFLVADYDEINADEVIHMLQKEAPEIYAFVGKALVYDSERGVDELHRILDNFGEYRELKRHQPEKAEFLLKQARQEFHSRLQGVQIHEVREKLRKNGPNRELEVKLAAMEKALKTELAELFAAKLTRQEQELKELEAEVAEIQESLENRRQNRERIIDRRFLELTGQAEDLDW